MLLVEGGTVIRVVLVNVAVTVLPVLEDEEDVVSLAEEVTGGEMLEDDDAELLDETGDEVLGTTDDEVF